jgi:hypothetical protein
LTKEIHIDTYLNGFDTGDQQTGPWLVHAQAHAVVSHLSNACILNFVAPPDNCKGTYATFS